MKNIKEFKKPFFANFLEKQIDETDVVNGGGDPSPTNPKIDHVTSKNSDDYHTLKYPSDGDDDPIPVPR